ncbi:MAG: tetratricopeptide repeat-containing sulfotransferase family protein [Steroidobacteraceae bacterium]
MNSSDQPTGSLGAALANAERLLASDPELAAEQASEILVAVPGQPLAVLLLGMAHRLAGRTQRSLEVLATLVTSQQQWAPAHFEYGQSLATAGKGEEAILALRRAVELKPDFAEAWRVLAAHLEAIGDHSGAGAAFARHLQHSATEPRLLEAGAALCDDRVGEAEALLRTYLKEHPTDVAAIRMLAEVALRLGRNQDAETLLTRCLELAPGFTPARYNRAIALHRLGRAAEARTDVERVLLADSRNPAFRNLHAAILGRIGEFEQALEVYAGVLSEYPNQAKAWMSYGHALKAAGRGEECVAAYRRCIELQPGFGEAWWSLANLKTHRFTAAEIGTMRVQLARQDLGIEDRLHFEFTLGKAEEDAGRHAASFRHYEAGNHLRRSMVRHDPDDYTRHLERTREVLTRAFLASRQGCGDPAPDPILVVGLPRAGSTLIEQILASHPQVEGTMELPDVIAIARSLGGTGVGNQGSYLDRLAGLEPSEFAALGRRYLEGTRIQRKTAAPFFVDKMPNNFLHAGLVHLMLPNARIIDARRHPMACCFSNYKQHFARGQLFTYDLEGIGRYYRDYVALMAHFDEVLPGRVHRVFYERMVEDTEGEVRRLLDHCGLPFDEACLRFHENERAVRTASSEQVRQPIYREGLEQWRYYEAFLAPLREALGPVLEAYPDVPPTGVH